MADLVERLRKVCASYCAFAWHRGWSVKQSDGWIPINELNPPPHGVPVLLWSPPNGHATHWMPLPAPPKESSREQG